MGSKGYIKLVDERIIQERNMPMSLELINNIFAAIRGTENWSVHLLGFKHSKRCGTIYNCRRIELESRERTEDLVNEISALYIGNNKCRLAKYNDVREYDGTCNGTTIYRISEENDNIVVDLELLFEGIANSDVESNPLEMKCQAYVLCNTIVLNNEEHTVKLIAMNNPIMTLKNKFFHSEDKFWEITDKVLNLKTIMNVMIWDRTVYFFDMSGETLFNMDRAYKIKCGEVVNAIQDMKIISDIDVFKKTATTGHNPRRFSAFSQSKLDLLTKKKNREKAAQYFEIPLTGNKSQFDTSNEADAEKLVKVLCGKAMWDILEEVPVEVDGSKYWTR